MQATFTIELGQNSWLATESYCCDSGIIRFPKSSTVCYEQSGSHSRSDSKTIIHLHRLLCTKGDAT